MVVIGAGNTAIDAAIASVRLGATDVHIVYRRGPEQMSAFPFEYEHARNEGVKFLWHVQPTRIRGGKVVEGLELIKLVSTIDGPLVPQAGSEFSLEADLVVLSIGQGTHTSFLFEAGVKGKVTSNGGGFSLTVRQARLPTRSFLRVEIVRTAAARLWMRLQMENAPALALRRGWRCSMSKLRPTLETTFCGIPCLNPFWLASAPPTNCGEQIMRAFDAGWGGAVWKTIGAPITNVSSRYSSIDWEGGA